MYIYMYIYNYIYTHKCILAHTVRVNVLCNAESRLFVPTYQ